MSSMLDLSAIIGKKTKGSTIRNSSLTYRKVTIGRNFDGANFRPVAGGLSFWIRVILAPVALPFLFMYTCMCTSENNNRKIYVVDEDEDLPYLVRKYRSIRRFILRVLRKLGLSKIPEHPHGALPIHHAHSRGSVKAPVSRSHDPAFALALLVARTDQINNQQQQSEFNRELDAAEAARNSIANEEIIAAGGGLQSNGKWMIAADGASTVAVAGKARNPPTRPDSQQSNTTGTDTSKVEPVVTSPDEVSDFREIVDQDSDDINGNASHILGENTQDLSHKKSSLKPSSQAAVAQATGQEVEPYMEFDDVRMTNRVRKNMAKKLDENTNANRVVPFSDLEEVEVDDPIIGSSGEPVEGSSVARRISVSFIPVTEIIGTSQTAVEDDDVVVEGERRPLSRQLSDVVSTDTDTSHHRSSIPRNVVLVQAVGPITKNPLVAAIQPSPQRQQQQQPIVATNKNNVLSGPNRTPSSSQKLSDDSTTGGTAGVGGTGGEEIGGGGGGERGILGQGPGQFQRSSSNSSSPSKMYFVDNATLRPFNMANVNINVANSVLRNSSVKGPKLASCLPPVQSPSSSFKNTLER